MNHVPFNYYVGRSFHNLVSTLTGLPEEAQRRQGLALYHRRIREVITPRDFEQAQSRLLQRSKTAADLSDFTVAGDGWKDTKKNHLVALTMNSQHITFQSFTASTLPALGNKPYALAIAKGCRECNPPGHKRHTLGRVSWWLLHLVA